MGHHEPEYDDPNEPGGADPDWPIGDEELVDDTEASNLRHDELAGQLSSMQDPYYDPGLIPVEVVAPWNEAALGAGESSVGAIGELIDRASRRISEETSALDGSLLALQEALDHIEAATQGTSSTSLVNELRSVRFAMEPAADLIGHLQHVNKVVGSYLQNIGWVGARPPADGGSSAGPAAQNLSTPGHVNWNEHVSKGPLDGNVEASLRTTELSGKLGDLFAARRGLPRGSWNNQAPLRWVLPELAVVEDRARVLADNSRGPEHADAARDVIDALRIGIRGLLSSRPQLTDEFSISFHQQSEDFLRSVGMRIDASVQSQGLSWPPSQAGESSVASDLIFLYRRATDWATGAEVPELRLQLKKMLDVEEMCIARLAQQDDSAAEEIARALVASGDESPRSRISVFLSATALAISLIQGPGALHDLPEDIRQLGGDVANVAAAVFAAILWALDEIWSLIASIVGS